MQVGARAGTTRKTDGRHEDEVRVMSRRAAYCYLTLCVLVMLAMCRKSPSAAFKAVTTEQMRATVVTIKTTLQPSNRTTTHTILVGPEIARSTDEAGTWRLYDFKQNRIIFVD